MPAPRHHDPHEHGIGEWNKAELERFVDARIAQTPQPKLHKERLDGAPPTIGTWGVGDITWYTAPATGSAIGWVCTVAGTPGTWRPFGAVT